MRHRPAVNDVALVGTGNLTAQDAAEAALDCLIACRELAHHPSKETEGGAEDGRDEPTKDIWLERFHIGLLNRNVGTEYPYPCTVRNRCSDSAQTNLAAAIDTSLHERPLTVNLSYRGHVLLVIRARPIHRADDEVLVVPCGDLLVGREHEVELHDITERPRIILALHGDVRCVRSERPVLYGQSERVKPCGLCRGIECHAAAVVEVQSNFECARLCRGLSDADRVQVVRPAKHDVRETLREDGDYRSRVFRLVSICNGELYLIAR